MNSQPNYAVDELVFHRKPMLLIKQVLQWDEQGLEMLIDPLDSHPFLTQEGQLPSWLGIEYMAQSIGALSGIFSKQAGQPIAMGFLLGTRQYIAYQPFFELDKMLKVRIKEILRDETNLVLFDCAIYVDDVLIAQAELKAIQPPNLQEMFEAWGVEK